MGTDTFDHTKVKDEEGAFFHIVTALCAAVAKYYEPLRHSYDRQDLTMMAWSCRNLLEVAIYTSYVLKSNANADAFASDRLIDAEEISGTELNAH